MKNVFAVGLAAAVACSILSFAAPQQTTAAKTFRESAFTADQADRGAQVYAAKCATCHGDTLMGVEMAPPLAGATFRKAYETQPLTALANRIRMTMPPTAPNSLSAGQLTDLVSFILKSNDIRAGTTALSLPAGSAAPAAVLPPGKGEWTMYGADLASTRYSPLDQINKDNFGKLQMAWRLNTNNLGPTTGPAIFRDAPDGEWRPLHNCRERPFGCGSKPWHRTDVVDVPDRRRRARPVCAASRRRARSVLLVEPRRSRSTDHLRYAGIPDDRAERKKRPSGRDVRQERHRRSQAG